MIAYFVAVILYFLKLLELSVKFFISIRNFKKSVHLWAKISHFCRNWTKFSQILGANIHVYASNNHIIIFLKGCQTRECERNVETKIRVDFRKIFEFSKLFSLITFLLHIVFESILYYFLAPLILFTNVEGLKSFGFISLPNFLNFQILLKISQFQPKSQISSFDSFEFLTFLTPG